MRLRLAILLLLVCACIVEARPRPPPPRVLPPPEAVAIATQFARSRGLVIDYTHDTHLDRHARWHVDLGGAGGRDRAVVTLDGFSGRVLAARLRGPQGELVPVPQSPPPGVAPEPVLSRNSSGCDSAVIRFLSEVERGTAWTSSRSAGMVAALRCSP